MEILVMPAGAAVILALTVTGATFIGNAALMRMSGSATLAAGGRRD